MMANYYTLMSECITFESNAEREWLQRMLQNRRDCDPDGQEWNFIRKNLQMLHNRELENWPGFSYEFEESHLALFFEEIRDLKHVVALCQSYLREFHPDRYITLNWAFTCSSRRFGAFSGGGCFVTAERQHWISVDDELFKLMSAFEQEETQ